MANTEALDYCATVESWAAQTTLQQVTANHKELNTHQATAVLLHRSALKDGDAPVLLGEWGQLYTQTIKITIPFWSDKKSPLVVLATSIISAEECSLSQPSYVEIDL